MGTAVSRLTGFVRSSLLVAALGAQLHADLFTIANTLPNMLYILVAGGVFNTVLIPHLVRSMKRDADGGQAYVSRVLTLAAVFLAGVTLVLMLSAPLLLRVVVDGSFYTSALIEQRESMEDLARYCLPQVFFYGMFVVVGQVLNSRGAFGPMMWAPIANNFIAIAVLVLYLVAFGPARDAQLWGAYEFEQELVLGLGSTAGILAQFCILAAYLRGAGITFRPRWDFRGSGLDGTLKLAGWTIAFVLVNQAAYAVIMRLASEGAASAAAQGAGGGAGYTVYSNAFLLIMVPHAIVTVSVTTAVNPTLAALAVDGDLGGLGVRLVSALRQVLALILPISAVTFVVAPLLADLLWGYAGARASLGPLTHTLTLFAPGLTVFTVHYLILRGLFALERHRTVFWIQCLIAVANVILAVVLTADADNHTVAPLLAVAYGGAYLIGAVVSFRVLGRLVGGLATRDLAYFLGRILLLSGLVASSALGASIVFDALWPLETRIGKVSVLAELLLVISASGVLAVVLSRVLRVGEISGHLSSIATRVRRRATPP